MTFDDLYKIIEERRKKMPDKSYVASLFRDGTDRIIQKVGEEATEVVIAAKNNGRERIISEVADLFFHVLVLLSKFGISLKDVLKEFERRDRSRIKK